MQHHHRIAALQCRRRQTQGVSCYLLATPHPHRILSFLRYGVDELERREVPAMLSVYFRRRHVGCSQIAPMYVAVIFQYVKGGAASSSCSICRSVHYASISKAVAVVTLSLHAKLAVVLFGTLRAAPPALRCCRT